MNFKICWTILLYINIIFLTNLRFTQCHKILSNFHTFSLGDESLKEFILIYDGNEHLVTQSTLHLPVESQSSFQSRTNKIHLRVQTGRCDQNSLSPYNDSETELEIEKIKKLWKETIIPSWKDCLTLKNDWKYTLCFGKHILQQRNRESYTIGKNQMVSTHNEILFNNGDLCDGRFERKTLVRIMCGKAFELKRVTETEICVYELILTHPDACKYEQLFESFKRYESQTKTFNRNQREVWNFYIESNTIATNYKRKNTPFCLSHDTSRDTSHEAGHSPDTIHENVNHSDENIYNNDNNDLETWDRQIILKRAHSLFYSEVKNICIRSIDLIIDSKSDRQIKVCAFQSPGNIVNELFSVQNIPTGVKVKSHSTLQKLDMLTISL